MQPAQPRSACDAMTRPGSTGRIQPRHSAK
jgi:hypothetical protein